LFGAAGIGGDAVRGVAGGVIGAVLVGHGIRRRVPGTVLS
jgi:hypothetical protein